jgi:hypothetical protein
VSVAVDFVTQVPRFHHDLRDFQDGNVACPCILWLHVLLEPFVNGSLALMNISFVESANVVDKANISK